LEGRSLVEKKLTSDGGWRADCSWVMIWLFVSRSRKWYGEMPRCCLCRWSWSTVCDHEELVYDIVTQLRSIYMLYCPVVWLLCDLLMTNAGITLSLINVILPAGRAYHLQRGFASAHGIDATVLSSCRFNISIITLFMSWYLDLFHNDLGGSQFKYLSTTSFDASHDWIQEFGRMYSTCEI
jgi:hypothetical protein